MVLLKIVDIDGVVLTLSLEPASDSFIEMMPYDIAMRTLRSRLQ